MINCKDGCMSGFYAAKERWIEEVLGSPGLPWRDSALALSQGSHKWHLTPIATDSKMELGMMQVRTYEQEMWMSLAVNKHSTWCTCVHSWKPKWGADSWQGLDSIKPFRKSVDLTMPKQQATQTRKTLAYVRIGVSDKNQIHLRFED